MIGSQIPLLVWDYGNLAWVAVKSRCLVGASAVAWLPNLSGLHEGHCSRRHQHHGRKLGASFDYIYPYCINQSSPLLASVCATYYCPTCDDAHYCDSTCNFTAPDGFSGMAPGAKLMAYDFGASFL